MVIKRLSLAFVFILIFSILVGSFPQSIHADGFSAKTIIAKEFSSEHPQNDAEIVPGQVIVKYKHASQNKSSFGIKSIGPSTQVLHFSNETSVSDKIAELKKDPNVEYAEPDYIVHLVDMPLTTGAPVPIATSTPTPGGGGGSAGGALPPIEISISQNVYFSSDLDYMHNWGKTAAKLKYAQEKTTKELAANVIVAVVDTGVYMEHPDLVSAKIPGLTGRDFAKKVGESPDNDPQDDNGHGTNVAGIIAANGNIFSGVAPGTKILPVKVLDSGGIGETSQVIEGINYAVSSGANIINLSIGSPGDSQALHDAIINAVKAGVLVVAAAGNDGNNISGVEQGNISDTDYSELPEKPAKPFIGKFAAYTNYPAAYPEVISVAALEQLLNKTITLADFSNVGKIDVAAPGVNIYSTYIGSAPNNYKYMSGTSQATPFVSGFAALLKANDPSLDVERLTVIIEESAALQEIPEIDYSNEDFNLNGFDLYGYGIINGESAFKQTRLELNAVGTKFDNSNHVTLNVTTKDYKNISTIVNGSITGSLYQIFEDSYDNPNNLASSTLINLTNGTGETSLENPKSSSMFYYYYLYVDDSSLAEHNYIYSNIIEFVNRPSVPTPLDSGRTFTGSHQITLTSTASDSIYYSLDNWNSINHYDGPFTISQNTTLLTYAKSNHVYSDVDGSFNYVINSSSSNSGNTTPSGGGGGGCGACGYVPQLLDGAATPTATPTATPAPTPTAKPAEAVVTKGDNGKSSLEVKPNKDVLIAQLNKSKDDVIIDAKSTESINAVSVDLDGNVLQKAKEKGTAIVIQSNDLQIHFAPDTLNLGASNANVKFSATIADNQILPDNIQAVSTIYDFNLSVDNVDTHTFNKPIEVHFSIDPTKIHNMNNLGVFYYNDTTQKWEYVGGTVNADNTVTALLPHFSKYAVLENSKTFADVKNHWAKNEIEEMAAKQIINGMTESSFKPEANITRAQFVSLLARALRLEAPVNTIGFNDVPANAWYKNDIYSAFSNQIVKGITENRFAPDDNITREQLATLLVNAYLQKTGKQLSDIMTTQEVKFTDEGGISNWARVNVRIAASLGLMSGSGSGKFNPKGLATRAEAAVALKRFLNKIN
jgi:subtilisin family serine protease